MVPYRVLFVCGVTILTLQVFVQAKWTCSECKIRYKAIGCYKDHFKRPLPEQILNERDETSIVYGNRKIDWTHWNEYMAGFACRCAAVAKSKGYSIFGLQFYGECWSGPNPVDYKAIGENPTGCVGSDYKNCTEYDRHCAGKKEMNFVYQIVSDEDVKCDIPLETVGCYNDKHVANARPLPLYPLTDRDSTLPTYSGRPIDWRNWDIYMPEFACRCAHQAKKMGKTTFGVQYFGECWTSDKSDSSYIGDGASNKCVDKCFGKCKPYSKFCSGEQYANFVYRIAGSPCEWKTTPLGCYKEVQSSRALPVELVDEVDPSNSEAFNGHIFNSDDWKNEFSNLLCRCARAAKKRGFSVFGVHNTGTCWGSDNGETYQKHGKSSECIKANEICSSNSDDCAGNEESIFVYKVVDKIDKSRLSIL